MSVQFGAFIEREPGNIAKATQIEIDYEDPHFLDLSNANALLLLQLLRLQSAGVLGTRIEGGLVGAVSVPDARRAIMYARATFERRAAQFTREPSEGRGQLGARFVVEGLDADGLALRLEKFARFVEFAAGKGATHICWA